MAFSQNSTTLPDNHIENVIQLKPVLIQRRGALQVSKQQAPEKSNSLGTIETPPKNLEANEGLPKKQTTLEGFPKKQPTVEGLPKKQSTVEALPKKQSTPTPTPTKTTKSFKSTAVSTEDCDESSEQNATTNPSILNVAKITEYPSSRQYPMCSFDVLTRKNMEFELMSYHEAEKQMHEIYQEKKRIKMTNQKVEVLKGLLVEQKTTKSPFIKIQSVTSPMTPPPPPLTIPAPPTPPLSIPTTTPPPSSIPTPLPQRNHHAPQVYKVMSFMRAPHDLNRSPHMAGSSYLPRAIHQSATLHLHPSQHASQHIKRMSHPAPYAYQPSITRNRTPPADVRPPIYEAMNAVMPQQPQQQAPHVIGMQVQRIPVGMAVAQPSAQVQHYQLQQPPQLMSQPMSQAQTQPIIHQQPPPQAMPPQLMPQVQAQRIIHQQPPPQPQLIAPQVPVNQQQQQQQMKQPTNVQYIQNPHQQTINPIQQQQQHHPRQPSRYMLPPYGFPVYLAPLPKKKLIKSNGGLFKSKSKLALADPCYSNERKKQVSFDPYLQMQMIQRRPTAFQMIRGFPKWLLEKDANGVRHLFKIFY